jgi:hypothetical protein
MDCRNGTWRWHTLVHVCKRWRHIVLTSPRRLDLRLLCTVGTPVRKYLDCWPPTLPIIIDYKFWSISPPPSEDVDNIFAALENPNRVCSIELLVTNSVLEKVSRVMQGPFPALKNLFLWSIDIGMPIISQGFLGGSALGLQKISLSGIPSSGLPKLFLSCRDLVELQLLGVHHPDHISPEVIVATLSSLSRLKTLNLEINLRPDRSRHLPPPHRSTLSTLSEFTFRGRGEYLEDLIARIDTPFLQRISISFCHMLTFDVPQLRQLICRTEGLRSPDQATMVKIDRAILLWFGQAGRSTGSPTVIYPQPNNFSCTVPDWQITSVAQFCLQSMPLPSGVKQLAVDSAIEQARWGENVGPADWLDLFRPFSAVEELYVSRWLGSHVASALAGATGQAEMLPALRSVFFEGDEEFASVKETVEPFFAARKLSHCPIVTYLWEREV